MTIAPLTASVPTAASLHATGTAATEAKKTLDKEVFLQLLVAQLRNQDPTSPMDTTEMMAQSTQLASMEQLTAVADTSREAFALQMRVAALGLIGQEVGFTDADGITRTGLASAVDFGGPVPMVTVGEWTTPLDSIRAARTPTTPAAPVSPVTQTPSPTPSPTPNDPQDPTDATDGADAAATDGSTSTAPTPAL